jgi:predicted O-linked N-acetylglucosamine transferase (SPINDLY family)
MSQPAFDRSTLARRCLRTELHKLPRLFRDTLGPSLAKSWELALPRGPEDEALAERIRTGFGSGGANVRNLMAALPLLFPFELPRIVLEDVPEWLLATYLKYLHRSPPFFPTVETQRAHVAFLRAWSRQVAAHTGTGHKRWQAAAQAYAAAINVMPAYFSDENLKDLYTDRAKVLDYALRQNGFQLDHDFPAKPQGTRLRIGFLNASWGPKTETFATLPLFEFLDRDRFEVVLLSPFFGDAEIDVYCRGRADRVVLLEGSVPAQAATVRACDLDILFFGTNLTLVTHPLVVLAMHRLARIQVTSICSPATTGMPSIDYFLAGTLTEPSANAQAAYTERLIRLEGSGLCFHYAMHPPATGIRMTRASLGIPADATLLVSGANFFKLGPELRQAWAEILAAAPDAHLALYPFGPAWSATYAHEALLADLRERLRTLGVAPERLVFLRPFESIADIPGLLGLADLYLDSFPYGGATSLLDPLSMGVPPIVMDGNQLRFAQGGALLRELGMEELVAADATDYMGLSVRLIRDTARRQALRERIRAQMAGDPPFLDRRAFAVMVAGAFERMVKGD